MSIAMLSYHAQKYTQGKKELKKRNPKKQRDHKFTGILSGVSQ